VTWRKHIENVAIRYASDDDAAMLVMAAAFQFFY
jgi:hypothetical protein